MPSPRNSVDQLVAALLERAGGWFVLSAALEQVAAAERVSPSADGAEWARRVVATCDRLCDPLDRLHLMIGDMLAGRPLLRSDEINDLAARVLERRRTDESDEAWAARLGREAAADVACSRARKSE